MLMMNKKMAEEMRCIDWGNRELPSSLSELITPGFCEQDGCIFFVSLRVRDTNATTSDFPDKTGYECFVNSIHIDDFVQFDYLPYACLFVETCFAMWRRSGIRGDIKAIISSDELGALVKFHLVRDSETWVDQDLEKYEDGILVVDSTSMTLR